MIKNINVLSLRFLTLTIFLLTISSTKNVRGAENSRLIKVERLSKPKKPLRQISQEDVLRKLIVNRLDTFQYIQRYNPKIWAHSTLTDSLVNFGYNSFFRGMFEAYAGHRPFAISPDAMWLLICQGFSKHINSNQEALRDQFVDFDGQMELVISSTKLPKKDDWSKFIDDFTKLVAENTKGDIVELLECDFSSTTLAERVASQATILNSLKNYFDYSVIRIVCGIPKVELHGTVEDWQEIIRRTKELSKYDLEWWTAELIPILEEISRSAAGDVDKLFWREMFKYHTKEIYGNPKYVDGWIVKFYPYTANGKRNNLVETTGKNLPDEIVRVPIKFIDELSGKTHNLELCAGFLGLEQNPKDFMLTPKIGWYLYEIESVDEVKISEHIDNLTLETDIINQQLPKALFRVKSIDSLTLHSYSFAFEVKKAEKEQGVLIDANNKNSNNSTLIPQRLGDINIKTLNLFGFFYNIDGERISDERVLAWCAEHIPNCEVILNKEMPDTSTKASKRKFDRTFKKAKRQIKRGKIIVF